MAGITFDPLEAGFNADSRSFKSLKKAFTIGPEQTGNAVYSIVVARLIQNAREVGPITWYAAQAHINDLSHRIALQFESRVIASILIASSIWIIIIAQTYVSYLPAKLRRPKHRLDHPPEFDVRFAPRPTCWAPLRAAKHHAIGDGGGARLGEDRAS